MKKSIGLVLFCCSWLLGNGTLAQMPASPLPEQQVGDIVYVSGGIGETEREEIRLRAPDFNLQLLFVERDGSYLAGIDVQLSNARGETVIDARSVGPFLLVRLPAGRYVARASMEGEVQQRSLAIPARGQRQGIFRW